MKMKTGYESGTSPMKDKVKVSISGAPIQTGRGLEETKRRILEAFEKIRCDGVHATPAPRSEAEVVYTEKQAAVFHSRVRALSVAALTSSAISKYNGCRDSRSYDLGTVDGPQPTADQLIAAAMASR
jgi:hypothetical protein